MGKEKKIILMVNKDVIKKTMCWAAAWKPREALQKQSCGKHSATMQIGITSILKKALSNLVNLI